MYSPAIRHILRIGRIKATYNRTTLHIEDLNDSHYLYVSYICRHPGDRQDKLVEDLCVDKTTVAHQIQYLEKKGFIYRESDPNDKRCKRVYPTPKATKHFQTIHQNHANFTSRLMEGLSEDEKQELDRLTGIVYQNALTLLKEEGVLG